MIALRFDRRDIRSTRSKCPKETILRALDGSKVLLPDSVTYGHELSMKIHQDIMQHGITIGVRGERVLAAACHKALAIANHHVEGRHDHAIREAELFLPPVVGPRRGKFDVLLLDTEALLDTGTRILLSKIAVMAVAREAYGRVGKNMDAAHMGSYLKLAVHALQLRQFEEV